MNTEVDVLRGGYEYTWWVDNKGEDADDDDIWTKNS
jgi:hypothetical protein